MSTETIYRNEELHIDGTAKELFDEVKNGSRVNVSEIDKIAEILMNEDQKMKHDFCLYRIEEINNSPQEGVKNISSAKLSYLLHLMEHTGNEYPYFKMEDVEMGENISGTLEEDTDGMINIFMQNRENNTGTLHRMEMEEFLNMTQEEFEDVIDKRNHYTAECEK